MAMPKALSKETLAKIIAGVLIAIIPASYTYCQSMYEIRQKYRQSHVEAEAGYAELVKAVKELQDSVKEQHDQIIQVQAYTTALESLMRIGMTAPTNTRPTGSSVHNVRSVDEAKMTLAKPRDLAAPDLTAPAPDFDSIAKSKK